LTGGHRRYGAGVKNAREAERIGNGADPTSPVGGRVWRNSRIDALLVGPNDGGPGGTEPYDLVGLGFGPSNRTMDGPAADELVIVDAVRTPAGVSATSAYPTLPGRNLSQQ
jgi:hypothetical protein